MFYIPSSQTSRTSAREYSHFQIRVQCNVTEIWTLIFILIKRSNWFFPYLYSTWKTIFIKSQTMIFFHFIPVSIFSAEVLHCACCNKDGLVKNSSQRLTIGDQTFCSEQCLNQFRRTPKRNKTCDWCRHVRHSVTYVDLQDGDRQYQFCR